MQQGKQIIYLPAKSAVCRGTLVAVSDLRHIDHLRRYTVNNAKMAFFCHSADSKQSFAI